MIFIKNKFIDYVRKLILQNNYRIYSDNLSANRFGAIRKALISKCGQFIITAFISLLFIFITPIGECQSNCQVGEITLEHKGCFGECPVYKITLRSDGGANYFGEEFVNRIGKYKGKIGLDQFNRLEQLLKKHDYINWKDSYGFVEEGLDMPVQIITVNCNKNRKIIKFAYEDEIPIEIWNIKTVIEWMSNKIIWEKDK